MKFLNLFFLIGLIAACESQNLPEQTINSANPVRQEGIIFSGEVEAGYRDYNN